MDPQLLLEGIKNPNKIPNYLRREFVYPTLCQKRVQQKRRELADLDEKLANTREEDNFCLIVLDACRYDALKQLFGEFFTGQISPVWSVAKNTFEYQRFMWQETYEYPYITGAAPVTSEVFEFSENEDPQGIEGTGKDLQSRYCGYIPSNHFLDLVEVWREEWDQELGVCPPEPVTEKAKEIWKKESPGRMVVHYFQPHGPFIGQEKYLGDIHEYETTVEGGAIEGDIWTRAKKGIISDSELRALYDANLQRVLGAVGELIRETDFEKYIIMADHGEALGEYGMYYHSIDHPKVREVPWAIIDSVVPDAPQMWDYHKESKDGEKREEGDTISRLKDLGYL